MLLIGRCSSYEIIQFSKSPEVSLMSCFCFGLAKHSSGLMFTSDFILPTKTVLGKIQNQQEKSGSQIELLVLKRLVP